MSERGGAAPRGSNQQSQDPASDPSSNDSTAYSFPQMVEVDVSTSSVISERGGGSVDPAGGNLGLSSSVLSDVGMASPGEALKAASLAAAQ